MKSYKGFLMNSALTILSFLCWQGVECRPELRGDEREQALPVSILAGVVGFVGLVVVVLLCAENKKVNPSVRRTGPPEWTQSLFFNQDLNTGFSDTSEGLHAPTPFHIVRERLGQTVTDAARWTCPMSQGKHVFEVYWPQKKNRGPSCCIGLGSADVGLKKQGRCSLVGEHSQSWGLDLARHRSIHFNATQQRLHLGIPDRFFVYVDMDSGKIGFGGDVNTSKQEAEFFGYICHGIPKNKAMYLMISMCSPREQVHVYYRGTATPSGGYNLLDVPSPLQFSVDNLGNLHIVPVQSGPPTYMSVMTNDKGLGQTTQPQPEGPFQPGKEGQPLQF